MIFKVHSRCNLNCTYCYVYNAGDQSYLRQPRSTSLETVRDVVVMIRTHAESVGERHFHLCFHGGEPLLVGKSFFAEMMRVFNEELAALEMHYAVQTNATLVDTDWVHLFERFGITVGASLDGPETANGSRVYNSGKSSTEAAIRGIRLLQDSNVDFAGVISVVNEEADGAEVVRFFTETLQLKWFDFLLPDYTHDTVPAEWPTRQAKFTAFLIRAFDQWYSTARSGVACRMFDSVVAKLLSLESSVDTIGMNGLGSIVIETDGSLEPHDVLRICPDYDRATGIRAGAHALERFTSSPVFMRTQNREGAVCNQCKTCSQYRVCQGGHYAHRYSATSGFLNPSVHCEALYQFLGHVERTLAARLTPFATATTAS